MADDMRLGGDLRVGGRGSARLDAFAELVNVVFRRPVGAGGREVFQLFAERVGGNRQASAVAGFDPAFFPNVL